MNQLILIICCGTALAFGVFVSSKAEQNIFFLCHITCCNCNCLFCEIQAPLIPKQTWPPMFVRRYFSIQTVRNGIVVKVWHTTKISAKLAHYWRWWCISSEFSAWGSTYKWMVHALNIVAYKHPHPAIKGMHIFVTWSSKNTTNS